MRLEHTLEQATEHMAQTVHVSVECEDPLVAEEALGRLIDLTKPLRDYQAAEVDEAVERGCVTCGYLAVNGCVADGPVEPCADCFEPDWINWKPRQEGNDAKPADA